MDKRELVVVFDSLTGQTERFASKLGIRAIDILDYEGEDVNILLATRSYDFGQVTEEALDFLSDYSDRVLGTVISGNRNWGTNYGAAGREIEKDYNIPIVLIFEGSGFRHDIELVKEWIINNQ